MIVTLTVWDILIICIVEVAVLSLVLHVVLTAIIDKVLKILGEEADEDESVD